MGGSGWDLANVQAMAYHDRRPALPPAGSSRREPTMTAVHDNRSSPATAGKKSVDAALVPWLAGVAALVGRLPALGSYWNQDDWGLLARAGDLMVAPDGALRWLSRVGYWEVMWPLAGLDPVPYAWTRLALHALAAAGVAKLALALRRSVLQAGVAGLIMAAAPLAFTPLYWAAGVQDLLAVACGVWALVLWSGPGPWRAGGAVALAAGAMFAKETVVGLPLIMLLLALWGPRPRRDASRWWGPALAAGAAAAAVVLALGGFATASDQPYALGDGWVVLGHLLTYGWWLLQPGPTFTPNPELGRALAGGALWMVWGVWAVLRWRRGDHLPALAWAGALVTLAPLLPLVRHLAPDLAYPVEPFGCLALACLVPSRLRPRVSLVVALALLAIAWGFSGMRGRLSLRDASGRPADPVVSRTAVSWQASRTLPRLPIPADDGLVIVQQPVGAAAVRMADQLGEDWVTGSLLYDSWGGALGPRLVLGPDVPVRWTNGLRRTPREAFVVLDAGGVIKPWGHTHQALLYQTLTDVGLGHLERARLHLLRSGLLADDTLSIVFDADLLPVSLDRVLARKDAFLAHLAAGTREGRSLVEVRGMQTNFLRLLSACTGIDEATLREPSAVTGRTTQ